MKINPFQFLSSASSALTSYRNDLSLSFPSVLKKIPFPSIIKPLSQNVIMAALSFVSVALVVFISKQFFNQNREQNEASPYTPPRHLPSTPARTPFTPGPLRTPFTPRHTEAPLVDGDQELLAHSILLEGQTPIAISSLSFLLCESLSGTKTPFGELYGNESLVYVEGIKGSIENLEEMIQDKFSNDAKEIMDLLDHLPELVKKLFPNLSSLPTNGPVDVSVTLQGEIPQVLVNNLLYKNEKGTSQVFICMQKCSQWTITIYCTTWAESHKNACIDDTFTSNLYPLPEGINLAPPKGFIFTESVILQEGLKQKLRSSSSATKETIFPKKEFDAACSGPRWTGLNTAPALLGTIGPFLFDNPNLQINCSLPRTIVKTSRDSLVFVLFPAQVNKTLLQIGAFIQLTVKGRFFRDYFCQLKGGFHRELMPIHQNEHPLVAFINANMKKEAARDESYVNVDVLK